MQDNETDKESKMKWWQRLRPVAADLILLGLVLVAVLVANIGHAAGSVGTQGYGLKIFKVESGL